MEKNIKGIKIQIGADVQLLKKALEGVNSKTKDIQGELKQVERLLKLDPKNTELLAQKQKLLADKILSTKDKLEILRKAENQLNEDFNNNKNGEEQHRALQREIIKAEQDLKKLEKEIESVNNKWEDASNNLKKFGEISNNVGKNMSTKITLPIMGVAGAATAIGMNFEQAMSKVQAVSGASEEDIKKLEKAARDAGATTSKSATDAADALNYMSLAGWSTKESMDALLPVLRLSEAGGIDLGRASDLVTDSMSTLGLTTEELMKYLDKVAETSRRCNSNIDGLLDAHIKCGGRLHMLHADLNESTAMLGILADKGIKASEAGIKLDRILTNIAKPVGQARDAFKDLNITAYDSKGNFKGLEAVFLELKEKLEPLTEEQRNSYIAMIGGKEHADGLIAILSELTNKYPELKKQLEDADGALLEMAETMMENNKGSITELKSALEELGIKIYNILSPSIAKLVDNIKSFVGWLNNLSPSAQRFIVLLGGILAAIGPILIIIGKMSIGLSSLIKIISPLVGVISSLGSVSSILGRVLLALKSPIGILAIVVSAVVATGIAVSKFFKKELIPEVKCFGDKISESSKNIAEKFLDINNNLNKNLQTIFLTNKDINSQMRDDVVDNITEMSSTIVSEIERSKEQSLNSLKSILNGSKEISKKEKEIIINNAKDTYDTKIKKINEAKTEIIDIMDRALKEKRNITEEERKIITKNQELITSESIKHITENELEQKIIFEKMKENATIISARQASEVIKNSLEQKDKTIKEAEDQCNKVIGEIIRQRDELCTITQEQAEKLIEEAKRQKDAAIENAEEMHIKIIEKAKEQSKDYINLINWETGEILTKWNEFKIKTIKLYEDISKKWNDFIERQKEKSIKRNEEELEELERFCKNVKNILSKLKDTICNIFNNLRELAFNWGKNMIDGFIDGIHAMIERAANAARRVVDAVSGFLGFNSPAKKGEGRYIINWGYNMIEGFMDGMKKAIPELENLSESIIPKLNLDMSDKKQDISIDYNKFPKGETIINIYNPAPTPSELARQIKKSQRDLAMGF